MYAKEELAKGFMEFHFDFLEALMRVWKEVDTQHPPVRIQERLDCPWTRADKPWHKDEPGECYLSRRLPLGSLHLHCMQMKYTLETMAN